jgi:lysophospholipase L1-like esterase
MAALLLGEVTLRLVVDEVHLQRRMRAGGVIVPYEPGVEADLLADEFRARYRINRFGYRDRLDRRPERTPGVARIVLLGDSFAAGWGVAFTESFGDRLERTTGIEVVNAAKNGGCPLWFVPQARHVRGRFSPDWLLVQLFDNDPDDNTHYMDDFELEVGAPFVELPPAIRPLDTLRRHLSHRFESSVLRRRLRQLSRRIRGKNLHSTPYVKPDAMPDRRVLSREEAIAKHDLDFSKGRAFLAGMSFHDPSRREAWRERLDWNAALVEQLAEETAADGVRLAILYIPTYEIFLREPAPNPLAERIREVAARHDALWLDAGEEFARRPRPHELYYAYDGHLDPSGHAAVAHLLERVLAPRVLERRGDASPQVTSDPGA